MEQYRGSRGHMGLGGQSMGGQEGKVQEVRRVEYRDLAGQSTELRR